VDGLRKVQEGALALLTLYPSGKNNKNFFFWKKLILEHSKTIIRVSAQVEATNGASHQSPRAKQHGGR
jgi:hypothetical protein